MAGQTRPHGTRWPALLVLVCCAVLIHATTGAPAQTIQSTAEMLTDACLHDVIFIDPRRGWAVGDRGVIRFTDDGGQHWRTQHSGVDCPLQSVCFIDADNGWAAGGWTHPHTHKTTGVVLRTRDGGRHWTALQRGMLPALKRTQFFDAATGWALGTRSALYPAGVFYTDDGGRHWSPVPGGVGSGWLAGDFRHRNGGVLAGRDGSLATAMRAGIRRSRTPNLGLRHLRRMRLVDPTGGYLVGDGGLVLTTVDGGLTWQMPVGPLPRGVIEQFDFSALAVCGPRAWVAGSPGTRVLHTPDGGRTWEMLHTGQNLPIRALSFVDPYHGWAVGALGTILATRDGGRSWHRQHCGGTRAAVVGVFGQPSDVPLELFARLCAKEGYLGFVEILGRHDVEVRPDSEADPAERTYEALVNCGACGARTDWRFPLRQAGLRVPGQSIIDAWDRANDGHGITHAQNHVVRAIRQWRPDVMVTDASDPRDDDPLAEIMRQIVLGAVEKAADPTTCTDQITVAGLSPWKVKRVFGTLEDGVSGDVTVTTAQLAPRLGRSLSEQALTARGILSAEYAPAPQTIGFQLLLNRFPRGTGRLDFFSGISLVPGGDARRILNSTPGTDMAQLRRQIQKRRNLQQLFSRSASDAMGGTAWLGQVTDLVEGLNTQGAGEILYHLGRRYHATGYPEMAAETFQLLVDRYGDHSLTEPALVWLVQYYASGETAWRLRGRSRFHVRQVSSQTPVGELPPIDRRNDAGSADTPADGPHARPGSRIPLHVEGTGGTFGTQTKRDDRSRHALSIGELIRRTRPALAAEPAIGLAQAAAFRSLGQLREADRIYQRLGSRRSLNAWQDCAGGERWLASPRGAPPKKIWRCRLAPARPRLDGKLDDSVWQTAEAVDLKNGRHDDALRPATAMVARDGEFLYLAIRCRCAAGVTYSTTDAPRPRDPDLSKYDRVDLLIDLDRDFATYYRLTVDHRGFAGEACFGDTTWNPTWYIAANTHDDIWSVEAAIPLDQLAPKAPTSRDVWAVGVQRTVPGVGFQSWTQPAAVKVKPQGFGYLVFD